jgi:hypothetical protein
MKLLALLSALAMAACTSTSDRAAWTGTIDTLPGGIIMVTNPATGIWDSATGWTLTEELVIGDAESDTAPLLSDVAALEVDSTGRIYVLDRQLSAVLVFDHQGALATRFGRQGEGPGEFRGPNGIGWDQAGRLWVIEGQGSRNSIFDREGRFLETRPRTTGFYGYIWNGKFLDSGEMIEPVFDRSDSYSKPMLARYDSVRGLVDTVTLPYTMGGDNFFRFEFKNGYSIAGIPFYPAPWSWIDPRGFIWTGNTGRYELTQLSMQGDTIRVIRKEQPPIPVSQSELDSAIARLKEMAQGAPFDEGKIPRIKPVLERVVVDDSGYVWVMTMEAAGTTGTGFDVFDPEGRFLGRVTTPRQLGPFRPAAPMVLRRGKLWGVVVDEDDLPGVARWAISR